MWLDLNNLPDEEPWSLGALTERLLDRCEDLFREAWGEPAKPGASEWRAKAQDARAMVVRGGRRGAWIDHRGAAGGGPLQFLALEVLGWPSMPNDSAGRARLRDEAARWLGLGLGRPVTPEERTQLQIELSARAALREAQAVREAEVDNEHRRALVAALRAASRPVEGTAAEAYLRSRGITTWPEEAVAYLPPMAPMTKLCAPQRPSLVIWARNAAGEIVGGQRVLLTAEGGKANVDTVKPSFAQIGSAPARFPARVSGAPLVVAEGPETALAIWSATGWETWAVFGANQFRNAPLPTDRRVILAPDQDAEGSVAAQEFATALALHAGHPDLWVARAPEPVGSKCDLADTLLRAGPEAVCAAIRAAEPVGKPWGGATACAPTGTLLEARRKVNEAFEAWMASVDAYNPESGSEAPVMALRVSTGVGKSYAARQAAASLVRRLRLASDMRAVVIAVPRHNLSAETAEELRKIAPDLVVELYYGRDADDPRVLGQKMCWRAEEAAEAVSALVSVEETLCLKGEAKCPFIETCGYMRQKRAHADIWIVPHALLWKAPPPQIDPAALIVDEDPSSGAYGGFDAPVMLSLDDLQCPLMVGGSLGTSADLSSIATRLANVLRMTGERVSVAKLLDAGLTIEDMTDGRKLAFKAKQKPNADPTASSPVLLAELARIAPANRMALRRARLFGLLREAIEAGADLVPGVYIETVTNPTGERFVAVRLRWRNEVAPGWHVPTLVASAIARIEVLRRVWPALGEVVEAQSAMPFVTVRQITDRAFAASTVCPDPLRSGPEALRHAASTQARLKRYIEARGAEVGGPVLVVGQKGLIEALRATGLPCGIETAHFNSLSGLDRWGDIRLLINIGRTMPSPDDVETRAEVLSGGKVARIDGWYPLVPAFVDLHGSGEGPMLTRGSAKGKAARVGTESHPDPLAEAIRWGICEGELLQAIGRGRGVNRSADNPLQIDILTAIPLPLAVSEAGLFEAFEPGAQQLMSVRGVVVSDTSAKGAWPMVAAVLPDLFPTPDAARMALHRSREQIPMSYVLGKCSRERATAKVRLPGARYAVPVALHAETEKEACALLHRLLPGAKLFKFQPARPDNVLTLFQNGVLDLNRPPEELAADINARARLVRPKLTGIALPRRILSDGLVCEVQEDDEIRIVPCMSMYGFEYVIWAKKSAA